MSTDFGREQIGVDGGTSDGVGVHRREVLMSRLVDGEASEQEWGEFCALADTEAKAGSTGAWRELARAQRDHAALTAAVEAELARADGVRLPHAGVIHAGHAAEPPRRVVTRVSALAGWAALAAVLSLGWFNGWLSPRAGSPDPRPGVQAAGAFATPEAGLQHYLTKGMESGQVMGEEPNPELVLTRRKVGEPGVIEVFYFRKILERTEVKNLYRIEEDEAGGQVLVPAGLPAVQQVKGRLGV
ncbi:MAG: hypothetical protein KF745_09560 [Phycisphaeraceae bacterium]|nr:hypothetical protein [Phycisphaeraceae bacterium]